MRINLQNITYGILGSLILIGIIIMYGVARASVFNLLYFLIGLSLTGIPLLIFWMRNKKDEENLQNNTLKLKKHLRDTGDQITVDLTKTSLKSNSWKTTEQRYSYRISMLNAIGGDSELNIKETNNNVTRITFATDYKGQSRIFDGETISKDRHTIQMLLEHHGRTKIYVDRTDPNHYFFDLDFLRN